LIVTITEGVGLLPQAAFLSSALRELGFEPSLLATDFCTTQDGFQTAVRQAMPSAIVFPDALEWREILVTLSGFACDTITGPVAVLTTVPEASRPDGFGDRVTFLADGDPAALAKALGVRARPLDLARIPMDYGLFGGAAALDRAMTASLFGDVGTAPLLASRADARLVSGTAALARLEGPLAGGGVALSDETALAPLHGVQSGVRRVEWWDRFFDTRSRLGLLRDVWRTGIRQSVRLAADAAEPSTLEALRSVGVDRVVFECGEDAGPEAEAAERCHAAGLEAGALLVIGLPAETAAAAARRCETLRRAAIDRVRVVPFEPAGGTPAWERCVSEGWWPPKDHRWNRELYQPLEQPQAAEYPKVLEEALMLVADVEARSGAGT
jgi:hypothetical protein